MTNKEFLMEPLRLRRQIEKMEQYKCAMEHMADAPSSPNLDMPVVDRTRMYQAPFTNWIDKLIEVDASIAKLRELYASTVEIVTNAIGELANEDYRTILIMHYINGDTWDTVASAIHVSFSTVKRWHYFALNALVQPEQKKLNHDEPL